MYFLMKSIFSVICVAFIIGEFRKNFISSSGQYFIILFLAILSYDIFALNYQLVTIKGNAINSMHIFMDRIIILPVSLFFLQNLKGSYYKKIGLSMGWIFLLLLIEVFNEKNGITKMEVSKPFLWCMFGLSIITLSFLFNYFFQKLMRREINASSNKV